MTVPSRLDRSRAALIVIDVQERLFPAMNEDSRDRNLSRLNALIAGARALELPIIWTEQYPAGLGPTVESVSAELEGLTPLPKTSFSCLGDPAIADAVRARINPGRAMSEAGSIVAEGMDAAATAAAELIKVPLAVAGVGVACV